MHYYKKYIKYKTKYLDLKNKLYGSGNPTPQDSTPKDSTPKDSLYFSKRCGPGLSPCKDGEYCAKFRRKNINNMCLGKKGSNLRCEKDEECLSGKCSDRNDKNPFVCISSQIPIP